MSCFNTVSTVAASQDSDLTKHVNFTSGMILGVDDFTQEFAYLAGRDRWLARDALGYGTISGLGIRIEKDAEKGFRVMILPGAAVSPRGQFICVPAAQCAYLNQWLEANAKDVNKHLPVASPPVTSPPVESELTLFVTLCFRDCLTDNVPIPGEPCRSEDELTAASRVKDDFSLELRFDAPKQPEENAVRKYIEWLRQIKIVETEASTPIKDFLEAIRTKWLSPSSPPVTSPPMVLQIKTDDICEYMRAAFRLWITELRIKLSERQTDCAVEMIGGADIEDCVLLAELRVPLVPLASGFKVSDTKEIVVNEEKRPFLLHLRMLQEWMLCGYSSSIGTTSPITSPPVTSPPISVLHNHSLDNLSDVTAPSPSDGQILTFRSGEWLATPTPTEGQILIFKGGQWVAEIPAATGGTSDHGALNGLGDDDHPQYLLADGSRGLTNDWISGGNRITNLAAGTGNGDAVIFEQAIKQNDAAGGDLSGKYPKPIVAKLQKVPVSAVAPTEGQTLIFRVDKWIPEKPSTGGNGVTDHGVLTGLDDDDHPQYLKVNPIGRSLESDLNAGGFKLSNLADGVADNDAVTFKQAVKIGDVAQGDLSGNYPIVQVDGLQGRPISVNAPALNDVLKWNGAEWIPSPPSPQPKTLQLLPLATITPIDIEKGIYEIWFNIDAPENQAVINKLTPDDLLIFDETKDKTKGFLDKIDFTILPQNVRNVFAISLTLVDKPQPDFMRFQFDLTVERKVTTPNNQGISLVDYAKKNDISFAGTSLDKNLNTLVTIFVRGTGAKVG